MRCVTRQPFAFCSAVLLVMLIGMSAWVLGTTEKIDVGGKDLMLAWEKSLPSPSLPKPPSRFIADREIAGGMRYLALESYVTGRDGTTVEASLRHNLYVPLWQI